MAQRKYYIVLLDTLHQVSSAPACDQQRAPEVAQYITAKHGLPTRYLVLTLHSLPQMKNKTPLKQYDSRQLARTLCRFLADTVPSGEFLTSCHDKRGKPLRVVLEHLLQKTPQIKLLPWHKREPFSLKEMIHDISSAGALFILPRSPLIYRDQV